jgi:RNA recognition motif. (a.k.a. RRM, RBD, or RNP domain)
MIEQSTFVNTSSPTLRVFLGGLPHDWQEAHVERFLQSFGQTVQVKVNKDPDGRSKGFGFATLTNFINQDNIYGRHEFDHHKIEIKEILQRCVFLLLPDQQSVSQRDIVQALAQLGHSVKSVDLLTHQWPRPVYYAKVTLAKDTYIKHLLDQRFVEIKHFKIECLGTQEKVKARASHANYPNFQSQKQVKKSKNNRLQMEFKPHKYSSESIFETVPQLGFNLETSESVAETNPVPPLEEAIVLPVAAEQQTVHSSPKNEAKVKEKKTSVPNSTQSSEENNLPEKDVEASKSYRKLSFTRGKHVEGFVPQDVAVQHARQSESYSGTNVSSSGKPGTQPSKLNPASTNWGLPNAVSWSAGPEFYQTNIFNPIAPYPNQTYAALSASSQSWVAPNQSQDSRAAKKASRSLVIGYFTFPGRD